jgi:hypothetical protein
VSVCVCVCLWVLVCVGACVCVGASVCVGVCRCLCLCLCAAQVKPREQAAACSFGPAVEARSDAAVQIVAPVIVCVHIHPTLCSGILGMVALMF